MSRSSLRSMLVAMIAMATIGVAGITHHAAAQQDPNICHYTVDIAGITPCCFPITVETEWVCPDGTVRHDLKTYNANGIYVELLNPNPPIPLCPPACLFNWASLNGPAQPTPLGATTQYCFRGCCWLLTATTDAAGGILLIIRPCP